MRVLFIAYRDFRNPEAIGGDFYLWELARGLSYLGHNVTILCSNFPGSKEREVTDGVEIRRLNSSWSLPLHVLKEYMQIKNNFDVIIEEVIGGQRLPFFCSLYIRKPLLAVWYQRNTKIFLEQYPLPLAIALSLTENFLAALYKRHTIIALSEDAKEKLVPLGLRRENIKVVYAGIGKEFDTVTSSFHKEDVVVWLGKLRRYKRVDHALLGFSRALQLAKKKSWKLVIDGKVSVIDKSYADELRALAKRLNLLQHVEFRASMSAGKKLDLLKKAKILLQPSPVEGFSMVVIEANRCGAPVVVSDGVPVDVARDGYNGFVYPYGDIETMASRIVNLMENENLWLATSTNSIEWSKKFTWAKAAATLSKIVEQSRYNSNCENNRVCGPYLEN